MSAPATYAEWRARKYGEPLAPARRLTVVPDAPKGRKRKAGTGKGRKRTPRPVREGHVRGGSRYCYALGCGHDDCYRADSDYYFERTHGYKPERPAATGVEHLNWVAVIASDDFS